MFRQHNQKSQIFTKLFKNMPKYTAVFHKSFVRFDERIRLSILLLALAFGQAAMT